jgi:hypothetical protein
MATGIEHINATTNKDSRIPAFLTWSFLLALHRLRRCEDDFKTT